MFSMNTLGAMVQKAGFVILRRELLDLQSVRDWDNRAPQTKQIRIVARKSMDPVAVDWPSPLSELAALSRAQQDFDRHLSSILEKQRGQDQKHARRRQRLKQRLERMGAGTVVSRAQRVRRLLQSVRTRFGVN
jgi:hypothetical protein